MQSPPRTLLISLCLHPSITSSYLFYLLHSYGVSLVPKLTHARKRLFEGISGFRKREFLLRTQF